MAHHAIKRLGPTGLIAIFVALALSLIGAGTAIAAAGGSSGGMSPVVAENEAGTMKAPITGTTEDGRKVKGSFTPSDFSVNDAGKLVVTGTAVGKVVGKGAPKSFKQEHVTATVEDVVAGGASGGKAVGGCDILNLVLGPLHLDVLGLVVDLDTVVLDIVAQPGPGNLLGNLLCQVAGLLDGPGGLGGLLGTVLLQVQGLLNQILGALSLA
jgi:hypothetical protein